MAGDGTVAPPATYYARVAPGGTVDDPKGLFRRVHTVPYHTDEALRRDGSWHPTETLERASLGALRDDLVEVSAEHATRVAQRWRESVEALERDLAAQGRGELGLRLATAAGPDEAGTRLDAHERSSVVGYLREAPMVVAVNGYDPDPFDEAGPAVVPLHFHTDGAWVWSESLAYFAGRYGLPPEPEFLTHMRRRRYRWPDVVPEVLHRAAAMVMGPGTAEAPAAGVAELSPRLRRLMELSRWHDEWAARHAGEAGEGPGEQPGEESDYAVHRLDVDPSPDAEREFMLRAREIMGLDPTTGLPRTD